MKQSPQLWPTAALVAAFTLLHAVYYATSDIRFQFDIIHHYIQFPDITELSRDLVHGAIWTHYTAPAFTTFVAALVAVFGDGAATACWLSFLACGLVLVLATYGLARELGAGPVAASAVAILLLGSPEFIEYEHWPLYTLPVTTALSVAAWATTRGARTGHPALITLAFGMAAAAAVMWAFWHLLWFTVLIGWALLTMPGRRRIVLIAAAVPLLVIVALYIRTAVLFGHFSGGTGSGFPAAHRTVFTLPQSERLALVEQGILSPAAGLPYLSPVADAPPEYRDTTGWPQIPLLVAEQKPNGAPNYNHVGYIRMCTDLHADALTMLHHDPNPWLASILPATGNYLQLGSSYTFTDQPATQPATALYTALYLSPDGRLSPILFPGFPLVFLAFLWLLLRRDAPLLPAAKVGAGFVLICVLWCSAVACLLEINENQRYRFSVDPMFLAVAAVLADGLRTGRWRRRQDAKESA